MSEIISEYDVGMYSSFAAAIPLTTLSIVSAAEQSTPGQPNPVRDINVLGLERFFDHAGNFVDGSAMALAIIGLGSVLDDRISSEHKRQLIIGTTAGSMVFATGVNIAYEVTHAETAQKTNPEAHIDIADAAYGSAAGVVVSAVFCAAALWQRSKVRRNK